MYMTNTFVSSNPREPEFNEFVKMHLHSEPEKWMTIENIKFVVAELILPALDEFYSEVIYYNEIVNVFRIQLREIVYNAQDHKTIVPSELSYKQYLDCLHLYAIAYGGDEYSVKGHDRIMMFFRCLGGFKSIKDGKLIFNAIEGNPIDMLKPAFNITQKYIGTIRSLTQIPANTFIGLCKSLNTKLILPQDYVYKNTITLFDLTAFIGTHPSDAKYKSLIVLYTYFRALNKIDSSQYGFIQDFSFIDNPLLLDNVLSVLGCCDYLPLQLKTYSSLTELLWILKSIMDINGIRFSSRYELTTSDILSSLKKLDEDRNEYPLFYSKIRALLNEAISKLEYMVEIDKSLGDIFS